MFISHGSVLDIRGIIHPKLKLCSDKSVTFTGGTKNVSLIKQSINMHIFQIISDSAFLYLLVVKSCKKKFD